MSIKRVLSYFKHSGEEPPSATGPLSHHWLDTILHDGNYSATSSSSSASSSSSNIDRSDDPFSTLSKNQQKRRARMSRRKPQIQNSICEEKHAKLEHHREEKSEAIVRGETPEMPTRYGDLPLVQSHHREYPSKLRIRLDNLSASHISQSVTFTARLDTVRRMSARLVFLVFRQQLTTAQGMLEETPGQCSLGMVQWAEHLRAGSIVRVCGAVQAAAVPVFGCSIHDLEVVVKELHVVVHREESLPFSVYEAEVRPEPGTKRGRSWAKKEDEKTERARSETDGRGRQSIVPNHTRLANRILDLRTGTAQAIFRLQAVIARVFRNGLDGHGFVEIHSPKLQGSVTESGSSVFSLNYFGRPAYLAQSPQLAKQMAIIADFERVYEIGALFRAENSNTHRHLTEFTGLDLEMTIEAHYHEMLEVTDAVLRAIFSEVYTRHRREVDLVRHQFPADDLIWRDETPIIRFTDAIRLLDDTGWRREDGGHLREDEDLHSRDEVRLGELVREKYGTDYYIIDKYPATVRPFYTMPDPEDMRFTNSFDMFIRGQEIVSAGQRIHDPHMLEESMRRAGVDPSTMDDYLGSFRWGAPPHAGAGIGLERLLMLLLQLGDIRLAALFHRDPKSFPPQLPATPLRHPEARTLNPDGGRPKMPPLEDLIANYGDATATSWLDERYHIWRDPATGAAAAYVRSGSYAILPGDPLCDPRQYRPVIHEFLTWLHREAQLKPLWLLVSQPVEELLSETFGWRSFSCISESRVDPAHNKAAAEGEMGRKIRRAEREGVQIITLPQGELVPGGSDNSARARIDRRIQDWLAQRVGAQAHLSGIFPWRDHHHRWYFYATDRKGEICGFVTLALLSPPKGMQIKYSFDFPGAPSGTIEYIITHAIQTAVQSGVRSLTFGAVAAAHLTPGHRIHKAKGRLLHHAYDALSKRYHLSRKSGFRAKMGASEEALYIAYPRHGLGAGGIRAILRFLEQE